MITASRYDSLRRADREVRQAVAVHVAEARDGVAVSVGGARPREREEHRPGPPRADACGVAAADDHVSRSIAVEVAGIGDRLTEIGIRIENRPQERTVRAGTDFDFATASRVTKDVGEVRQLIAIDIEEATERVFEIATRRSDDVEEDVVDGCGVRREERADHEEERDHARRGRGLSNWHARTRRDPGLARVMPM
ncbi:MAG TPA: hypothetical protein VGR31_03870 [Planctomycetota bacterium]|nr:hypothetical protein [Planctomycetota bacterium]